MNRQIIIKSLSENYNSFVKYITELSPEAYSYRYQQKWTAGQQLEHMLLCIKPILHVLSMDKKVIEQTFGRTERQGLTYTLLTNKYIEKFTTGGKASARFIPGDIATKSREILCETLMNMIGELGLKIETFSEQELDSLLIPHPLLGNLTLREMLYNSIFHVTHHQELSVKYLMNK